MNILYFTRDFSVHDARFLQALSATRHKIYFMRLEPGADLRKRLPISIQEIQIRSKKNTPNWFEYPTLANKFKAVAEDHKIDVVHAGPIPQVALIPALAGFPHLVSMSWGSDLLYWVPRNFMKEILTRYALKRSKVLVGDCKAVQKAGEWYGMSAEKIVLFPWGVDIRHFSPGSGSALRKRLGWERNFIILCVRSWEPIYGVDVVLKAFKEALQLQPDLRLLLPGSGTQKRMLDTYIRKNDLTQKIATPGVVNQEQLPDYYRAADLYVSASHSDGSSVSLLEAFACGLPALVSDIPSNLEWVSEGKTGWSFPDGDFHALAEQMLDKKRQSKKLGKMKGDCRKIIVEKADWKKNFPQLLRAYEMAMTG